MRALRSESGQSLVELTIATAAIVLVMAGLSNVFISGLRATSDNTARVASQGEVRTAVDRLEYEARCADTATILSSGAGVALTLPAWCTHATGTASWCVSAGSLSRYVTANCTGTGTVLASDVTSAAPFCLQTTTGNLPALHVSLTANADTSHAASDAQSATATIVLRNAATAASTSAACP